MRALQASYLRLTLCTLAALAAPAFAARIAGVSLQGEVGQAAQLRVGFDAPVARLGAATSPAPVRLDCAGGALAADWRWADERPWPVAFRRPPPPGLPCDVPPGEGRPGLDGRHPGQSVCVSLAAGRPVARWPPLP